MKPLSLRSKRPAARRQGTPEQQPTVAASPNAPAPSGPSEVFSDEKATLEVSPDGSAVATIFHDDGLIQTWRGPRKLVEEVSPLGQWDYTVIEQVRPWYAGSLRAQARARTQEQLSSNFRLFIESATQEEIHFLSNVLNDAYTVGDLFDAIAFHLEDADTELEQKVAALADKLRGAPLDRDRVKGKVEVAA